LSAEIFVPAVFIIFACSVIIYLLWDKLRKGRISYDADDIEKSIELFQADMEPLLQKLTPPHDSIEAAALLVKMRPRYDCMLILANRYPETSINHQKIFNRALKPVLERLSYATTSRECFRNPRFKREFDRFIRN